MKCFWIFGHDWTKWELAAKEKIICTIDGYGNGEMLYETYRRECKKCGLPKYKRIKILDKRRYIL